MRSSRLRLAILVVLMVLAALLLCACGECPHTELEKVVKKAPTCVATGEEYVRCKSCGLELRVGDIDFADHEYAGGVCTVCGAKDPKAECEHELVLHEAKLPTCTEIGWAAYEECTKCDYTTYMEYAMLSHMPEVTPEVAPSCEDVGYTEGVRCLKCSEVLTAADEIPALGHDEIAHEAKAPTCTEVGWDEYVTCSRCEFTTYKELPAAHTPVVNPGYAPTCTEAGMTDGAECDACGIVLTERKEISALGHDEIAYGAKVPTCTEVGWGAYIGCSRCDYSTKAEISALGHKYDNYKDTDCNVCGSEREIVCAHQNREVIPGVEQTCTEVGFAPILRCLDCGEAITGGEELPALGHDEIAHEAKSPTCTEAGWDAYVTCSRCDYNTKVEKAALGHVEVTLAGYAATCTKVGYTDGVKCDVCKLTLKEQEEIRALGHKYDGEEDTDCNVCGDVRELVCKHENTIVLSGKEAVCNEGGYTSGLKCSDCGETLKPRQIIPALGHDYIDHEGKAASCTEGGFEAYKTCSRCSYSSYKDIPATGHAKENVKLFAGSRDNSCYPGDAPIINGAPYVPGTIIPIEDAVELTEENRGWGINVYGCPYCNTGKLVEYVAPKAHAEVIKQVAEPTHEAWGMIFEFCPVCSYVDRDTAIALPPYSHVIESVDMAPANMILINRVEPTCDEAGVYTYECKICKEDGVADRFTKVEIPALGHVYVEGSCAACGAKSPEEEE